MTFEELTQKIADREIVTVGAACEAMGMARQEVIDYVQENGLKLYNEKTQHWYNEDGHGHC
ncbi:MAG: hypothetical protein LBI43_05005 [Streptococcaceae bacterium]|jgi:hypothetical protein|nr:hypothetical protein [Streptococcaceae bacterium]